jgi:hypothetical protein
MMIVFTANPSWDSRRLSPVAKLAIMTSSKRTKQEQNAKGEMKIVQFIKEVCVRGGFLPRSSKQYTTVLNILKKYLKQFASQS